MATDTGPPNSPMLPWLGCEAAESSQPAKSGESTKLSAAHTGLIVRLAQLSAMITYTLPPTADHVRISKCLDQLESTLRDCTPGASKPVHQAKAHESFGVSGLAEPEASNAMLQNRQLREMQQQQMVLQQKSAQQQQMMMMHQRHRQHLLQAQQLRMEQQQALDYTPSGSSVPVNVPRMLANGLPQIPYAQQPQVSYYVPPVPSAVPSYQPPMGNHEMAMQDPRTSSPPRGHALQDYQMQLMLLERQNRKRLEMAKQEQLVHAGSEATAAAAARPNPSYTRSELIEQAGWNDESLLLTSNVKSALQPELGDGERARYSRMRQRYERDVFLSSLQKIEKHPPHTLTRMKIIKRVMLDEIERDVLDQQRMQLRLCQYPAWKRFAFLRFSFERDLNELTSQEHTSSDVLIAQQAAGIRSAIANIRIQAQSLRGLDRSNESREYDGFNAWWSTKSLFGERPDPSAAKAVGKGNISTQEDEREDARPPTKKARVLPSAPNVDRLLHDIRSRRLKKLEEEQTSLEGGNLGTELERLALFEAVNLPPKQTELSEGLVPGKEEDRLQAAAKTDATSTSTSTATSTSSDGAGPVDLFALFTGRSKILLRSCQLYFSMESDRLSGAWHCVRALASEIVQHIAADRKFGEQSDHELASLSTEICDIVLMLAPLISRRNALKARQPEVSLSQERLHRSLKCLNEQELRISVNLGDLCYDFACLKSGHASAPVRKRMSHVASDIRARLGLWASLSDEVETALVDPPAASCKSALARTAPTCSPPAVEDAKETGMPVSPTSDDDGFTLIDRDV